MTIDAFRCSDASEGRDEPLHGTASFVRRWLLLEQPGPWGRNALMESRIPKQKARELWKRARAAGVRIVLVRRGVRQASKTRQCYFARTDDRGMELSHLALDSFEALLEVDLAPLQKGNPIVGATTRTEPLFLVCTHGRHDACCSIRGNPVSRLACAVPGMEAWECSHIGGDRFAANLVCFPHGIYYGRVALHDVVPLMPKGRSHSIITEAAAVIRSRSRQRSISPGARAGRWPWTASPLWVTQSRTGA